MYWPKKGSETYGCIQVTLLREDVMATYTIRTLQIRHLKVGIGFSSTYQSQQVLTDCFLSTQAGKEEEEWSQHGRANRLAIPLHWMARSWSS